ncbi:MAG TPA: GNAT family N-acetyltransferase [Propionibacteriaceae bacterium]|nr:GNAT family N-acetyltransferase [Propionibacteriaceae bacterium]
MAKDLRIVPVTAAHLDDLDELFARGYPRTCQCAYLRLTHRDYAHTSPADRRSEHHKAIRRASRQGRAAGMIAYDEAGPVGWVSFSPREEYARLVASRVLQPVDDQEVTSVVCFVIAPRARRQGVAAALLDAVIDYAAEHGVALIEGYPVDHGAERRAGADLWQGPRRLFEAAGFTVVATRQANAVASPHLIMRRNVP